MKRKTTNESLSRMNAININTHAVNAACNTGSNILNWPDVCCVLCNIRRVALHVVHIIQVSAHDGAIIYKDDDRFVAAPHRYFPHLRHMCNPLDSISDYWSTRMSYCCCCTGTSFLNLYWTKTKLNSSESESTRRERWRQCIKYTEPVILMDRIGIN
jgi:hypothetical protein